MVIGCGQLYKMRVILIENHKQLSAVFDLLGDGLNRPRKTGGESTQSLEAS